MGGGGGVPYKSGGGDRRKIWKERLKGSRILFAGVDRIFFTQNQLTDISTAIPLTEIILAFSTLRGGGGVVFIGLYFMYDMFISTMLTFGMTIHVPCSPLVLSRLREIWGEWGKMTQLPPANVVLFWSSRWRMERRKCKAQVYSIPTTYKAR